MQFSALLWNNNVRVDIKYFVKEVLLAFETTKWYYNLNQV